MWVALAMPEVLSAGKPLVVDVGFGARPWTTLETAARWRRLAPGLEVLGVEIDPGRVTDALPLADPPAVDFALGGFNLADTIAKRRAHIVRCYNVLRQYEEAEVEAALALMAGSIEPGGILIEGTSTPSGAMVAFDVWRRDPDAGRPTGLRHEALVFGSNLREPHAPADFRTILPKRLIHRMREHAPATFFEHWQHAHAVARTSAHGGQRRHWTATAETLRERFGHPIDPRPRLTARGYLALADDLR